MRDELSAARGRAGRRAPPLRPRAAQPASRRGRIPCRSCRDEDSAAYWLTHHELGVGRARDGSARSYEVEHPVWALHAVRSLEVEVDFGALYGPEWAFLAGAEPSHVTLAEGSAVSHHTGPRGLSARAGRRGPAPRRRGAPARRPGSGHRCEPQARLSKSSKRSGWPTTSAPSCTALPATPTTVGRRRWTATLLWMYAVRRMRRARLPEFCTPQTGASAQVSMRCMSTRRGRGHRRIGSRPCRAARSPPPPPCLAAAAIVVLVALPGAGAQRLPKAPGCPILPKNNAFNQRVDALPRAANSRRSSPRSAATHFHADFGSGTYDGGPIGIPYTVVGKGQKKVPVSFDYADESDRGPYPIPANAPIEGGANADGDRHVLVVDRDRCKLYELFDARPRTAARAGRPAPARSSTCAPTGCGPAGWTSADAAGLPILPGLARYDEVAKGSIDHALRFTARRTRRAYVYPARHFASRRRRRRAAADGHCASG